MNHIKWPSPELDILARAVIDAAVEVHRSLGPGFVASIYEEALAIELNARSIPFECQKVISVNYKERRIGEGRLDLLVVSQLLVELKAVETLAPIRKAQIISYLKAAGLQLGPLINFNVPVLRSGIERIIVG